MNIICIGISNWPSTIGGGLNKHSKGAQRRAFYEGWWRLAWLAWRGAWPVCRPFTPDLCGGMRLSPQINAQHLGYLWDILISSISLEILIFRPCQFFCNYLFPKCFCWNSILAKIKDIINSRRKLHCSCNTGFSSSIIFIRLFFFFFNFCSEFIAKENKIKNLKIYISPILSFRPTWRLMQARFLWRIDK